jgi:hypothetical protein
MRRALIGLCALGVGCTTYQPGSFVDDDGRFGSLRDTSGCLDVSVNGRVDPHVDGQVIEVRFGNRCDEPVRVDLAALAPTGTLEDGRVVPLRLRDRDDEVRPRILDGRVSGSERFVLVSPDGSAVVQWCVDLAGVDPDAHPAQRRTVCERARLSTARRPHAMQRALREVVLVPLPGCEGVPRPFRRFGDGWARSGNGSGHFTLGTSLHSISTTDLDFGGSHSSDDTLPGHVTGTMLDVGISTRVRGGLHAGGAFALGGASGHPRGSMFVAGMLLHVGYQWNLGEWFARAQVHGGGRAFGLPNAPLSGAETEASPGWASQWQVQSRLALERRFNPWWSVGAWVGVEALRSRELAFGVQMSGFVRSFDRPYRRRD